jgi:hypothetical protein
MFTDSIIFGFLCPGCGATLVGKPCMDVDAAREPVVRELLMDGVLNRYTCETCQHQGVSPLPVIYRNSRLGFCVVYVPPHLVESRELAGLFLGVDQPRKDLLGIDAKVTEGMMVFSMDELARQVRFREIVSKHHAEPWKAPPAPAKAAPVAVAKPGPAWTAEPPAPKVPGPKVQYRKTKELLLRRIAERFIYEHVYTDTDVTQEIVAALRKENQSLTRSPMYAPDHLRLGLIELGLMAREPDGSRYWKT